MFGNYLLLCGEIYFVFCIEKIEEKFMMYFVCQGYFSYRELITFRVKFEKKQEILAKLGHLKYSSQRRYYQSLNM